MAEQTDTSGGWPHTCPECMEYYRAEPSLVHAAASAGIAEGLTTSAMVRWYLAYYHRAGHRRPGAPPARPASPTGP